MGNCSLKGANAPNKCSGCSASSPSGPTGSPSPSLREPVDVTGPGDGEGSKCSGSASSPSGPLPKRTDSSPPTLKEPAVVNGPGDEEESKLSGSRSSPSGPVENLAGLEVLRHNGNGVWKVKLVIGTKQLEEILAEEVNVEALVERMREAAAVQNNPSPKKKGKKANRGVGWKSNLSNVSSHC